MLKRNLAPISEEVWNEIDDRAKEVFNTYLSARRVVKVNGPKGLDYTVVPEGRIETISSDKEVSHGLYRVKPLMESRVEFDMNRWELDNLHRGAKDIELEALEESVKKIALFEEDAIYNGIEKGQIEGLINATGNDPIYLGEDGQDIMKSITDGIIKLKENYAEKPYTLVVGEEAYKRLNMEIEGYPLVDRIKDLIDGNIIYSHVIDGALLLPFDHDDLEMTIGKDFSIGYQGHDMEKIRFFIMESFTFRVLDENIIVRFTV